MDLRPRVAAALRRRVEPQGAPGRHEALDQRASGSDVQCGVGVAPQAAADSEIGAVGRVGIVLNLIGAMRSSGPVSPKMRRRMAALRLACDGAEADDAAVLARAWLLQPAARP